MDNIMFNVAKKQTKHAGKIRDVIIGRVYKLINTKDDMLYIGSTSSTLSKRYFDHRRDYKKHNFPVYKHMREVGIDNIIMELLWVGKVESITQLHEIEQKFIDQFNPNVLLNEKSASSKV